MNTQTEPVTILSLYCPSCNKDKPFEFNYRYNAEGKPIYVCPCCGTEKAA